MTLGQRLRAARLAAGDLSARELDRLSGVAEAYATMIENEVRTNVGGGVLLAYSQTLGVTVDYLLTGAGGEPDPEKVRAAVQCARERAATASTSPDAA